MCVANDGMVLGKEREKIQKENKNRIENVESKGYKSPNRIREIAVFKFLKGGRGEGFAKLLYSSF